jgi:hypothetical protein
MRTPARWGTEPPTRAVPLTADGRWERGLILFSHDVGYIKEPCTG